MALPRTGSVAVTAGALAALLFLPAPGKAARPNPKGKPGLDPASAAAAAWDLAAAPKPFEEVCFQDRAALGGLSESAARDLLEPVKNQSLNLRPQPIANWRVVHFQGLAKLRQWAPDAVLRLSFLNEPQIRLHVWDGQQGVSLHHYPWPRHYAWAAYRNTVQPGEPKPAARADAPQPLTMLATDDCRATRLPGNTYELRCQDGAVVLTKGDIRILTVPLARPAVAIYLECAQATPLRELAVCRSGPAPEDAIRPHRLVLGSEPPATLAWKDKLPAEARLERLADGRVELSSGKTDVHAIALLPVPRAGLCEVIAEVEDATVGAGLCLADAQGQPLQGAEFSRDLTRGWTLLLGGKPGAPPWPTSPNPDNILAPYGGQRQWLRLAATGGTMKCWVSGDGVHWGLAMVPQPLAGAWRQVGLYVQPLVKNATFGYPETRRIRIRTLQVRELDALTDLAPEALVERAAALSEGLIKDARGDLGAWQQRVAETLPAGADAADWRCACAVGSLAAGADAALAGPLLDALVRDGLARSTSFVARLRLLQDAAVIWDTWKAEDSRRYTAHWERLGLDLLNDCTAADFDLLRRSYLAAPLWGPDLPSPRLACPTTRLMRDRLLTLLGQQRWGELHEFCRQYRYWHPVGTWPPEQDPLSSLVLWIHGETGGKAVVVSGGSRRQLTPLLNRDAYNVVSDLQAAADDKQYKDAAHMLINAPIPQGPGLVPDVRDLQLYTSFTTSVKMLVRRHPQFQEVLQTRLQGADQLRVEQSIAQGNLAAIQALAVQYFGTRAAAAADLWLGDRLMSAGDFARALTRYEQALPLTPEAQQAQVAARIRLASAMLGRNTGGPPKGPVTFGDTQVPVDQFEKWVAEMIQRNKSGAADLPLVPVVAAVALGASPAGFDAKPWSKAEGDLGGWINEVPESAKATDWTARQLSTLIASDVMLVANRFQVTANELSTGKQRWNSTLTGNQGRTHGWSLVPMRPVVVGKRVYARMLPQSGRPEIACLELAGGKKLWQRGCSGEIISDPLVVQGRLFALASELPSGGLASQLMLLELNPDTGDVLTRRLLFDVRGQWASQQGCQAAVVGGRIVATLAGAVFCVDPEEQVSWLRYSPCLPRDADPAPGQQYYQPPVSAGGRLFVSQPGTRSVECIELETGRLLWRRAFVGLRRILDVGAGVLPVQAGAPAPTANRLLVETTDGVLALNMLNGQTLWQRDLPRMLDGYALAGTNYLLCAQREPLGGNEWCPVLAYVELGTGRVAGRVPLWGLRSKQVVLGPVVAHGADLWCFSDLPDNNGVLHAQRNIMKLTASGLPAPPALADAFWTSGGSAALRDGAGLLLPGWTVLSAENEDSQGVRRQWNKADNVLALRGHLETPRLVRWLKVPPGGKPRLLIEFGCEPNQELILEVRAGDQPLHSMKVNEKSETWKTAEVDLTSCAGRTVPLSVSLKSTGFTWTYWKRLELQGVALAENERR